MTDFTPATVQSLGYRTDLFLLQAQGARITSQGEYIRIESPENPAFYWGNFLLFRTPPQDGDFARWQELFQREFRFSPGVRHTTFGWDSQEKGETADFEKAAHVYDPGTVLTMRSNELQRPERAHPNLEVRTLESDEDWEAMVQNQIECRHEGQDRELHEAFKRRQVTGYRGMSERGWGAWYGGFLEGQLVADCGLYFFGDVGRFQNVGTAPTHRRQGSCGALLHTVCQQAFATKPDATLVIVGDSEGAPERIYRSLGFQGREKQQGVCRWPL